MKIKRVVGFLTALIILAATTGSCKMPEKYSESLTESITDEPFVLKKEVPLKVYINTLDNYQADLCSRASNIYAASYGEKVEYLSYRIDPILGNNANTEDNSQKLYTDIIAGKGPDVMVLSSEFGMNIYKMMDAGAYIDLNRLINNDDGFDIDMYENSILEAGTYRESRLFMPIIYSVPLLLTTKIKMEGYSLELSDFSSYDRFLDTSKNMLASENIRVTNDYGLYQLFNASGWLSECIDFNNNSMNLDNFIFPDIVELMRASSKHSETYGYLYPQDSYSYSGSALYDKGFASLLSNLFSIESFLAGAKDESDNVIMIPIPNFYGNTTAQINYFCLISASSKNIEGAWDFIKILLSDQIQGNLNYFNGVGVKTKFIESNIKRINDEHCDVHEKNLNQLSDIYKSCDNAIILDNPIGNFILVQMSFYIENQPEAGSFETEKAKTENYIGIWLSE